jgi:hypothetical protein
VDTVLDALKDVRQTAPGVAIDLLALLRTLVLEAGAYATPMGADL